MVGRDPRVAGAVLQHDLAPSPSRDTSRTGTAGEELRSVEPAQAPAVRIETVDRDGRRSGSRHGSAQAKPSAAPNLVRPRCRGFATPPTSGPATDCADGLQRSSRLRPVSLTWNTHGSGSCPRLAGEEMEQAPLLPTDTAPRQTADRVDQLVGRSRVPRTHASPSGGVTRHPRPAGTHHRSACRPRRGRRGPSSA